MEKSNRQILREKASEIREQSKIFRKKEKALSNKQFRASLHYEDSLVNEDGVANINVDLTKVESPFSIYSYEKRMDPEIFSYIDEQVFFLRAEIPVVINFDDGGKYSDQTKEKITKCVKRYYTLRYEDTRMSYLKSLFFGILLAFIGICILATYIALSSTILKDNPVMIEIICILSWVFVWESVDRFFFTGHQNRIDIKNSAQLALADVTFNRINK